MLNMFALALLVAMVSFDSIGATDISAIDRLEADMQNVWQTLNSHASTINSITEWLSSQGLKQAAFTAYMSGGGDLNIGETAPIVFPNVLSNTGGGYHHTTGYFIAPCSGVYMFYFHMRSTNDHPWIAVSIYKNDQELLPATADGSYDEFDRGSVMVFTHVQQGDQVYCRHQGGSTWLEASKQTRFSGALIHAY